MNVIWGIYGTNRDGPSYAGTDLNLLALYPDLVIYKTGNIYQNLHFIILNSFCAYDMLHMLYDMYTCFMTCKVFKVIRLQINPLT